LSFTPRSDARELLRGGSGKSSRSKEESFGVSSEYSEIFKIDLMVKINTELKPMLTEEFKRQGWPGVGIIKTRTGQGFILATKAHSSSSAISSQFGPKVNINEKRNQSTH
jgi:hypothetical protein